MKQRIITGACFILVAIAVICFSDVEWVFRPFILLITVGGLFELQRLKKSTALKVGFAVFSALAVVLNVVAVPFYHWVLLPIYAVAILAFTVVIILMEKKHSFTLPTVSILLCMPMTVLFYQSIVELRYQDEKYGLIYLIFSVLIPIANDSLAYFTGRFFGKHKLAPITSPKKTVEGAIGGTLSALLIAVVIGLFYQKVDLLALCVVVLAASVIGQIGDLSMSCLKRIVGVKDYGNLFPGHGGFLDRFDSHMFVWPTVYLLYQFGVSFIG